VARNRRRRSGPRAAVKLSRESIETAINDCSYQLWRMSKKSAESSPHPKANGAACTV
jgi:hypothetical protein